MASQDARVRRLVEHAASLWRESEAALDRYDVSQEPDIVAFDAAFTDEMHDRLARRARLLAGRE